MEMNWKRLTAGAVALLAAFGMTACAKEPPQENPTEETPTSTELDVWAGWPDFGDDPIVLPDDVWE